MTSRYVDDHSMYVEASKIGAVQPDSYFAHILPSPNIRRREDTRKDLKHTIQSMGNEDLKETIFQFLQSSPDLMDNFLDFIERSQPTKALHLSREKWNCFEGFQGRDWSAEYSALLGNQDFHSKEWQVKMYRLSDEFFHAASLYAQVIISELPLPTALKSIQPVNIGGIAGGQKYIIDNILFKFSVDSNISNGKKKVFMYGGSEQRNDLAMKAASIEMRNMQTVLTMRDDDLFVPLMCVIDYQGHRIIASSILPIDKTTLCYGSSDGGITVSRSITELNEKMKKLAARLHLQEHRTGSRSGGRSLHMPGDIEVHLGMDNRYYMLDVARLMPPEAPLDTSGGEESRKIYYQTLRPELVLGLDQTFNSDAFSAWNDYEPNRIDHEKELIHCTTFLQQILIPGFAEALQQYNLEAITWLPKDKDSWMKLPAKQLTALLDVGDMTTTVHYYGINVRHLGLIRFHTTKPAFRDFLLVQCISRAMKNILRSDMRTIMSASLGSPTDMPLRDLVLETYNNIHPFGHIVRDAERRKSISEYWELVFERTNEQFQGCFSYEEKEEIKESGLHSFVNRRVDFRAVLYLFFKFGQVELKCKAQKQLLKSTLSEDVCLLQEFRLVRSDVQTFSPRIRKPFISSFASSLLLAHEAREKNLAKPNKNRLLSISVHKMQAAHRASPSAAHLNKELALRYWELSKAGNNTKEEVLFPLFWAIRHMEMALSVRHECDSTRELFEQLLDETEQKCHSFSFCVEQLNVIRSRKHVGIAACPKKRLATETSMVGFSKLISLTD